MEDTKPTNCPTCNTPLTNDNTSRITILDKNNIRTTHYVCYTCIFPYLRSIETDKGILPNTIDDQ